MKVEKTITITIINLEAIPEEIPETTIEVILKANVEVILKANVEVILKANVVVLEKKIYLNNEIM